MFVFVFCCYMIDILIIYMYLKCVLYVYVFYFLFLLDFIGRFQYVVVNDMYILEVLLGGGVSVVLFKFGRYVL